MTKEIQMETHSQQIGEDLRFVRNAVAQRDARHRMPSAIGVLWAVYVLIGYPMLDFNPKVGGIFLMVAAIVGGVISGWLGRRDALRQGERDDAEGRREGVHWGGLLIAI